MEKYVWVYIPDRTEHTEIILYYRYSGMLYTSYMSYIQIHIATHYYNLKRNIFGTLYTYEYIFFLYH